MKPRLPDRPRWPSRPRQAWRYLRTGVRLLMGRPIVSVTVVPVCTDGRIVLIRRKDTNRLALPGGMMDWGETVVETARRELMEETGLELVRAYRLVGVYSSPERDPRAHAVTILIAARARGELQTHDPLEVSEVWAFPPDELPIGFLAHDHDQQLRDFLSGRTVLR